MAVTCHHNFQALRKIKNQDMSTSEYKQYRFLAENQIKNTFKFSSNDKRRCYLNSHLGLLSGRHWMQMMKKQDLFALRKVTLGAAIRRNYDETVSPIVISVI